MKTILSILALFVISLNSSAVLAQTKDLPIQLHTNFYPEIDSSITKHKLKPVTLLPNMPEKRIYSHFSTGAKKGRHYNIVPEIIESDPATRNNMPIVSPGKTSKILIAYFDANIPYHYNMPLLKPKN